ncbi:stalk domain-containing protein [Paenibacillus sp. V4I5]|uniref:stalk domain-containing protein n=1 Tax=Paenibacillus sp. V4I5 TaxID=3042306 RepID=UPI002791AE5C|nr:stalk domain-containing protein [Paenibacillus sp. V4I5]MDQ0918975.1 antitoxin component YwqK of YwqJK toxin-antitoxin module [Paenibacillus sp. V4I5]
MRFIGKKLWVLILMIAIGAGSFGLLPKSAFAELFTSTDKPMEYTLPVSAAKITGNQMVYLGQDNPGWWQVFSRNLESGELNQLTDTKTYKQYLSAGGGYAVYLEAQKHVVLINLLTGEVTETEIPPYPYDQIGTDGKYIVFYKPIEGMLGVYNLETKVTKEIGKGKSALIDDGIVVYISNTGSIERYDAKDGLSRTLYKPTDGYVRGGNEFAFDGKNVIWTHSLYPKPGFQTRMLNVEEIDTLPQVLSTFNEFGIPPQTSIGTGIAAWPVFENGAYHIIAADIASRQTGIVGDKEFLIGIYNDQLVLRMKDETIKFRQLQKTGEGQIADTLVSAVPYFDSVPAGVRESIGKLGYIKKLSTQDNSVTVYSPKVPDSDFYEAVTISFSDDKDLALTKALKPSQKMVSYPWTVSFDSRNDVLKLSMTYMKQRVPAGEQNKLGIYRLDSGVWTYMGALFEENNTRLYTDIMESGVYAVLYFDVPNEFVRDYWMQKRIEQLNTDKPIRVFLDGEEVTFHQSPMLKDGSTTVEFRPIFEKLGLEIEWNDSKQSVKGTSQGKSLSLILGQEEADVNGITTSLPTAPFLNQGYTFVPLRFVGEATGRKVLWDANLKAVYIYDPATEGKLYDDNGALMYEGQLKNGQMNGKGKLYRDNGSLWYDAVFLNNDVVGPGVIYFSGNQYGRDRTGEIAIAEKFESGRQTGYVINIDDSSFIAFEGETKLGIFNGKGKLYLADKLVYDGEYKDNLYDGYGKYFINEELQYEGNWVKNIPNGHGKTYEKSEDKVYLYEEGQYVDGMLNGKGTQYYSSGAKYYEGNFVKGGTSNGTYYYEDGKLWIELTLKENGTYFATIYYENGERYVGEYSKTYMTRHGQGTTYDKDGNVIFQGKYKIDVPQP